MLEHKREGWRTAWAPGSSSCRRRPKPARSPARWRRPGFELVLARDGGPSSKPRSAPAEYMVCYPNVKMHDAFYRAAPKLKLVQLLSAGYDAVDLEAARRAKVPVSNNGGANAISVAEHAIMLMLTVSRKVLWQHANVAGGRWRGNGPAPRMYELYDKTLGIVGLGTIGKKVARLAQAFGMRVQYYDIARLSEDAEDALGVRFRLLRELLRTLRRRVAARAAERVHPPHDRRGRAGADEADGHPGQHLPRPGDRRAGARPRARRGQAVRRRPRRVRPGAAARRQSPPQARQRGADRAFRRPDLGQPRRPLPQRLRQRAARARGEPPLWVVPELL